MQNLFGKTFLELQQICTEINLPSYNARQISDWLYQKNVENIDSMSNLSIKTRDILKKDYTIHRSLPTKVQTSVDGTKKYLYPAQGNKFIEAAYIPDKDRATLCVSSQVGCKMGCLFCMTGKQGFQANLNTSEIINQIASLPERNNLTNIVYMGMGEPLDNIENVLKSLEILTSEYGYNMAQKRITVSTVGIIPAMQKFLSLSKCHLAISLHSPFDEERRKLMPVQHVYPIKEVLNCLKQFEFGQRRVSFEYIMFDGINDSSLHIKELTRLLNGISCRINLIRFHPVPGVPLKSPTDDKIEKIKDELNQKGILTTIRASRGQDIFAACGLLSTKELIEK